MAFACARGAINDSQNDNRNPWRRVKLDAESIKRQDRGKEVEVEFEECGHRLLYRREWSHEQKALCVVPNSLRCVQCGMQERGEWDFA